MSDGQRLTMHGRDHRTGGHDPIPFPPGLLGGVGSVDLAVTQPGSLLLRYKLGETSGQAIDTANFVAGVSNNLNYEENTTGVPPSPDSPWVSGNAATRGLIDHSEFGSGDDGCIRFNYQQQGGLPGSWGGANNPYPGALLRAPSIPSAYTTFPSTTTTTTYMKSLSVFFKATATPLVSGGIIAADSFSSVYGELGWRLYLNPSGYLCWDAYDNSGGGSVGSYTTSPGALLNGHWYHWCVTWDPATQVWSYYLNAVLMGTQTHTIPATCGTGLKIGAAVLSSTFGLAYAECYFYGEVDEVDIYAVTLTAAEVGAIFNGSGAGTTTSVSTVTVGSGGSGDPFATRSGTANQYDVMEADGSGGTTFGRAHIKTYHNGS